jgi:hypothetical protein
MSDLNELFKVAPGTAAFMTGQNQRQATEEKALKQQQLMQIIADLQQKHQQSADLHPYEVESKSLANIGEQAKIPGYAADSSLKGTTAAKAAGTLSSDIAAGISNNEETVSKNKSARQTRLGNVFYSMGPELEGQPAAVRAAYALEKLQGLGMKPDDPFGQRFTKYLQNTPAEELPAKLTAIGRRMIEESEKYRGEMDKQTSVNTSHEKVAAGNNATSIRVAELNNEARLQIQRLKDQQGATMNALLKSRNYAGAAAVATAMAMSETDPAQKLKLEEYAKMMAAQDLASKQAGATATGKIDTPELSGLPQVPTKNPMAGLGGEAAPTATPIAPGGPPVHVQAQQAFGAYEPDKYDYGINPKTGKFARKPKRTQ